MSIVYLNGEFIPSEDATISVLDRGFLFADGVYEVIPVYNGKPFRLDSHLQRLRRSLDAIRLDPPLTDAQWEAVLAALIERNGSGHFSIYLQISRGAAAVRDHVFPVPPVTPTVFAMTSSMPTPDKHSQQRTTGLHAILLPDIRWQRCDIKSISLLPNILLKQQAMDAGANEAILMRDDMITEGSASNVFCVKDGTIQTPPKSELILGGVTRDLVVELALANQLSLTERNISAAELRNADEIWITSSTKEVAPITKLDDQPVGNGQIGPIWQQMAQLYSDYKLSLFNS